MGPDEAGTRLSHTLAPYWINFAATGDPNGQRLPAWPAHGPKAEDMVEFADDVTILHEHSNEQLDVIDKVLRASAEADLKQTGR